MGEARRRKLGGAYSPPADPLEAPRRRYCGRADAGPVEDFRAPVGTIALTMDVQGCNPRTYLIDAAKLVDVMGDISRLAEAPDYRTLVSGIAAMVRDGQESTGIGLAALWTALHHPQLGAPMRDAVSEALRRDGRAHITWQFSPTTGLAMALAEAFVDLEGVTAAAPRDAVIAVKTLRRDASGTRH